MTVDRQRISDNYAEVNRRIREAALRAGRDPKAVRLVAITKAVSCREIGILRELGHSEFGENRIEVARPKIEMVGHKGLIWRFVGNIQRRKAPGVVELFDTADAIDRIEVAEALEKRCAEQKKRLRVLVEVNVSGEDVKHGFAPGQTPAAVDTIAGMEHLKVEGLMTMAPFVADPEQTRPVFAGLRELAQSLNLSELSMGMTNDYEVAVEEGATQVRIGTALFE